MSEDYRDPIGRKENLSNKNLQKLTGSNKSRTLDYINKINFKKKNTKWVLNRKCNGFFKLKILLNFFLIGIITLVIWGIDLDSEIRNRINGKVWQFPASIYGRIVTFEPEMSYDKREIIAILKSSQYRKVSYTTQPGDFSVNGNIIDLLRRPFNFPDNKEECIHARMIFSKNKLREIKNLDTGRNLGFFRLDPRLISMLQSPNGEQRLFLSRNNFPDLLVSMLIGTEDHQFYEHDGINLYSICRAFIANISAGHAIQGGSTLTQQLVKNLFLTNERSFKRKVREIYMALILDARYSKDRILELYLNEVYLGQSGKDQIRGFPLASLYYFGRPIDELSIDQQIMLVGMVKGASLYNPWRNPKLTLERRNLVLRLMRQQKKINQELYDTLLTRPLNVQPKDGMITTQPAFIQIVRNELQSKLSNKLDNLSGVKIFTTLDPISQYAAEKAVIDEIPTLKKRFNLKDLETAMVIVDRFNGEIRAVIGGAEPQFAGYNRALQARRSIGSLAKPATYLTALSHPNNFRLNSWIADEPIILKQPNGSFWKPMNNNHNFSGRVMLIDALINSMNVPTVNLGITLGLDSVVNTWNKLGIPKNQLHHIPAILLGALNFTPMEVAQAFQSIASGGIRANLSSVRSVISEDGKILYQSFPQAERVESEQATYLTLYTMQQVIAHGTARRLGTYYPRAHLAGKTGTTNDLIDSWFVGIDGKEVTIVWIGRDNNQTSGLYGSSGAMQLYKSYLNNQLLVPLVLTPPKDITSMNIDSTGNIICTNNTLRSLPVWTTSPIELCQKQKKHDDTQYSVQKSNRSGNSISIWLKKMLGLDF